MSELDNSKIDRGRHNPFCFMDSQVDWVDLFPREIPNALTQGMQYADEMLRKILKQDLSEVNYTSSFGAYERMTRMLDLVCSRIHVLESLADSPQLRAVMKKWQPKISAYYTGLILNLELWNFLKKAYAKIELKTLSPAQRRYIEETMEDFRDQGADLSSIQKRRLQTIEESLSELTQLFSQNVLDATNAWSYLTHDESKLRGVPEIVKNHLKQQALDHGFGDRLSPSWRIDLSAPCVEPILSHAHDRELRKRVWEARTQIGAQAPTDNTRILIDILRLRQEKAQIMGKAHFPEWVLRRRMVKTPERVEAFIDDFHQRVKASFQEDLKRIEAFRLEVGEDTDPIQPWDLAYWVERYRKEVLEFDAEDLRPYYVLEEVQSGLFDLCKVLFGIDIEQAVPDYPLWHETVRFYKVFDQNGRHLGSFYTDWYPRKTKRSGAWMGTLEVMHPYETERVGYICGNFTPPESKQLALLSQREVETLFHEFGHLLHHLLSNAGVESLSGTNVSWDFVELPSQLMENFCWERKSLDLFAKHNVSKEPVPENLYQKLLASRSFMQSLPVMRQLAFAKLDLDLHLNPHKYQDPGKVDARIRALLKDYLPPFDPMPISIVRQFSHLFSDPVGYASGYYSYKWAEVLEADAFTRFKADGVLSQNVGAAFVDAILSKGNTADPEELFQQFMGRDPRIEPLLERLGFVDAPEHKSGSSKTLDPQMLSK